MKKLLVALTGLVGITASSVSTIATTNVEPQNVTYYFAEQTYNQYVSGMTPLEFSIDNINLTKLGIKGLFQLQNYYQNMFIPGLRITFMDTGFPQINGDTWYTDRRIMGEEKWEDSFDKTINGITCSVDTSATTFYSGNDFMIRLSYQIFCFDEDGPGTGSGGGNVSVQTGSTIEFRS